MFVGCWEGYRLGWTDQPDYRINIFENHYWLGRILQRGLKLLGVLWILHCGLLVVIEQQYLDHFVVVVLLHHCYDYLSWY